MGISPDAFDADRTSGRSIKARRLAIVRAMEEAKLAPEQLDYINLHGTSTPINDVTKPIPDKVGICRRRWHSDVQHKILRRHLRSGSIETIFCLKAMETGVIPGDHIWCEADPHATLTF